MAVRFGSLQWWIRHLVEQTRWMAQCGGTRAGYQRHYAPFGRTAVNINAIYDADRAEWERARDRVREKSRRG